jgi:glutamate formiminotransferase / formiminotetrahydrofolate cyclodeaminase
MHKAMQSAYIECVANISEGRSPAVIDKIISETFAGSAACLLHTDTGADANRSVLTFGGSPEDVMIAAANLAGAAARHIDMRRHSGNHPRMGALDVCPFAAVAGISTAQLAAMAEIWAKETALAYGLPIYMYEHNAKLPHRARLEQIRRGGYEGLEKKMGMPGWAPDYGPSAFNPMFGAMVAGARNFLLAYNVNLASGDPAIAGKIAERIRESGYKDNGRHIAGLLKGVKAIGWYSAQYGCAQVSANITDTSAAGMHSVYNACSVIARELGTYTQGSELIGLVPYAAMLEAGAHWAGQNASPAAKIEAAIEHLGLCSKKEFSPPGNILEIRAGIIA